MDKIILFYWSNGAATRIKILNEASLMQQKNEPCFLQQIADKLKISHVGAKKHIDLLIENGYLKEINPYGKPIYLEITSTGKSIIKEFKKTKLP